MDPEPPAQMGWGRGGNSGTLSAKARNCALLPPWGEQSEQHWPKALPIMCLAVSYDDRKQRKS